MSSPQQTQQKRTATRITERHWDPEDKDGRVTERVWQDGAVTEATTVTHDPAVAKTFKTISDLRLCPHLAFFQGDLLWQLSK